MATNGEHTELGGSEILLSAARPDIFRKNAFRVTGLAVEASAGDVARQSEKLRMAERYGGNRLPSALPLTPAPDADQVREAVDRLRDPERRLVDEFFWFWPNKLGGSKDDEALSAMRQGDNDQAAGIWQKHESQQSISNVSMHNLAVLMHARALDLEFQDGRSAAIRVKDRTELWQSAYKRWKVLLEDEGFWSRLTARIRDIDDPRLTTGTARRMKSSLPLALLFINAQLAVRSAEAGNATEAQLHLAVMKASGFDDALVQDALRRAIEPIRDRIKTLCQASDKETDVHPEKGDQVSERLIIQTAPLLAVVDTLLPAGDPVRDGSHDEVANMGLRCQIGFGNKTENWKKSALLLESVLPIAAGLAMRTRIEENLRIVKTNRDMGICSFCKDDNGEDKCGVERKMYGEVQRTPSYRGTRITWSKRTVTVPRCKKCALAHKRSSNWATFAVLTSILIGIVSCGVVVSSTDDNGGLAAMLLFAFSIGGSLIGSFLAKRYFRKNILPADEAAKYPRIQELLKDGWHFGTEPAS